MSYVVQNVPLVAQTRSMACWYASGQMLVQWRRNRCQQTIMGEPEPSEVSWAGQREAANNGLSLGEMVYYAGLLGMRAIPPMTPTMGAIEGWLRCYGPIWTAGLKVTAASPGGYGHVVVIVGVTSGQLLIHDPEPVNVGTRAWRPQAWLGTTLSLATATIPHNFMHYPGLACA